MRNQSCGIHLSVDEHLQSARRKTIRKGEEGLFSDRKLCKHAHWEDEKACLWRGFLLSTAPLNSVGLHLLLSKCKGVSIGTIAWHKLLALCLEQWWRMVVFESSIHVSSPRDDQCSPISNFGSCSNCEFSFSCDFTSTHCSAFDSLESLLHRQHGLVSGQQTWLDGSRQGGFCL